MMVGKGVENAYVLDGGQTAEIIIRDHVSNHIDFNTERTVSDILYFATALPEDE
jgi:exopolysaccharide biosynthesis protein